MGIAYLLNVKYVLCNFLLYQQGVLLFIIYPFMVHECQN